MKYLVSLLGVFIYSFIISQCPTESLLYYGQNDIDQFADKYPNCTEIEGTLLINDESLNPVIDVSGLSQLRGVRGSLIVRGCKNLKTLDGLDNIVFIGGNLQIESNDSLQALYAFNNKDMKSIQGDIWISSNPLLTTLEAFQYLENIYSEGQFGFSGLYFWDNPSLIHVNELSRLNYVAKGIYFYISDNLESLEGLSNLTNIPLDLVISYAPQLKSIHGLHNLQSVGGNISLSNTGLLDLDEFYSLNNIGGALHIYNNEFLTQIDGLSGVDPNSLQGDREGYYDHIEIIFNPMLTTCASNFLCQILERTDIVYDIEYNGEGCSSYEEVSGLCGSVSVYEDSGIDISVYPIPAEAYFFIQSNEKTNALLIDARGQVVDRFKINDGLNKFPITQHLPGIYYLYYAEGSHTLITVQ